MDFKLLWCSNLYRQLSCKFQSFLHDLLAPEGYGEIIGGSERETDYDLLLKKIADFGLDPKDYDWYLELRKFGSVPHAGFGLGLERMVTFVAGTEHIREAIPFPRMINRIQP